MSEVLIQWTHKWKEKLNIFHLSLGYKWTLTAELDTWGSCWRWGNCLQSNGWVPLGIFCFSFIFFNSHFQNFMPSTTEKLHLLLLLLFALFIIFLDWRCPGDAQWSKLQESLFAMPGIKPELAMCKYPAVVLLLCPQTPTPQNSVKSRAMWGKHLTPETHPYFIF